LFVTVFASPRVLLALKTCTVMVAGSAGLTPTSESVLAKLPNDVTIDLVVAVDVVTVDGVVLAAGLTEPAAPAAADPVVPGVLLADVGAGPGALQLVEAAGTGLST
jgi:hypothetical protein